MTDLERRKADKALLRKLRRSAAISRVLTSHTCPQSRHVQIMADCITTKKGYPMLTEEPEHCAISLYSVLASLWEARAELARMKCDQP